MKKFLLVLALALLAATICVGVSSADFASVEATVNSLVDENTGTTPTLIASADKNTMETTEGIDMIAEPDGSDMLSIPMPCFPTIGVFCPESPISADGVSSADTLASGTPGAEICYIGIKELTHPGATATYHFGYLREKSEVKCEGYYPVTITTADCWMRFPGSSGNNLTSWITKSCSSVHVGMNDVKITKYYGCDYTTAEYRWKVMKLVVMQFYGMTRMGFYHGRKFYTSFCS